MRFVVAKRCGKRGAGLGNEILPWAKGWIASQVLDARLIGPSWGLNQRRYYRNFQTSRFDFLAEDTLLRLPHHTFTEQEFHDYGAGEFDAALRKWADAKGLTNAGSHIVCVEGMWGGYSAIRTARDFLLASLLNSRDTLRNLYEINTGLDPVKLFAAVHMRSTGDGFITPGVDEDVRGKFNIIIPGEWYLSVCEELKRRFGDRIRFHIFTDRKTALFHEMVRRYNPGQPLQTGLTECSDLLLMSQADLRICSVSSYSLAAAYLSNGPFVWYEPQLTLSEGRYSLWGEGEAQKLNQPGAAQNSHPPSAKIANITTASPTPTIVLGTPMDIGDPLPDGLAEQLDQKLSGRDPQTNLLGFGSLPASAARQSSLLYASAR